MPDYTLRLWDGERQYSGAGPLHPRKIQGRSKFDSVTLERGVVQDAAFADWAASLVVSAATGPSDGNSPPPQKSTSRSKFDSIPLERGVVQDTGFANWVSGAGGGVLSPLRPEVSRDILSKDLRLEFYTESGQLLVRYRISRGWVSEYPVVPHGGHFLHCLHRRDGKTFQETLAAIFEESLSRLRHQP